MALGLFRVFPLHDFARDGYAIIGKVLEPAEVDALIASVEAIPAGGPALERGGRVYASRNLLDAAPSVRALAGSESIRRLVEKVLGPRAFVVRALLFDKTSEANWTVPWHQDLSIAVKERIPAEGFGPWTLKAGVPHVQPPVSVLEAMLTVRVQLDQGTLANGPLRVVPGSHREGRLGVQATRDWLERVGPLACPVPSGGALVMRPLLLHASSPMEQTDGCQHRRVIHLEFAADALPGGVQWHENPESILETSRQ